MPETTLETEPSTTVTPATTVAPTTSTTIPAPSTSSTLPTDRPAFETDEAEIRWVVDEFNAAWLEAVTTGSFPEDRFAGLGTDEVVDGMREGAVDLTGGGDRVVIDDDRTYGVEIRSVLPAEGTEFTPDTTVALVSACVIDSTELVDSSGTVVDSGVIVRNVAVDLERLDGEWIIVWSRTVQRWEGLVGCAAA